MESLLESLSFFLLLVTVFVYWFETVFYSKVERQQFASLMVKLSNFSLTFLLGMRWITSHHFPLSNLYESLIFLSWSLTVIHLILEKTSHTLLIGVLLSPITLFVNGFALFTLPAEMQKGNFLTPALQSNWLSTGTYSSRKSSNFANMLQITMRLTACTSRTSRLRQFLISTLSRTRVVASSRSAAKRQTTSPCPFTGLVSRSWVHPRR